LTSFHDYALCATSQKALVRMDIHTPTSIQEQSLPVMLDGRDLIARAQTGSGKTLAFALPIMEHCDPDAKHVQAMILTPTRELARQVGSVLEDLSKGSGVRVTLLYGGVGYGPQENALKRGTQVVVGTPGRVLDHIRRRTMRLDKLEIMILDEADEMLDRGFAPDVERILAETPKSRQTALFSATTPDWVHKIATRHLQDPKVVESEAVEEDPDIEHVVMEVYREDKFQVLVRLLKEPLEGTTLVFGRTKHGVRNLGRKLDRMDFRVSVLQGNLGQGQRDREIERFRGGKADILVATNVAARGLDILHIARVINFDIPDTPELFTHRVGRTGRMGRSGEAITLVAATDLIKLKEIERSIGRKLPRVPAKQGENVEVPKLEPTGSRDSQPSRNGNGRSAAPANRNRSASRPRNRGGQPQRSTQGQSHGQQSQGQSGGRRRWGRRRAMA